MYKYILLLITLLSGCYEYRPKCEPPYSPPTYVPVKENNNQESKTYLTFTAKKWEIKVPNGFSNSGMSDDHLSLQNDVVIVNIFVISNKDININSYLKAQLHFMYKNGFLPSLQEKTIFAGGPGIYLEIVKDPIVIFRWMAQWDTSVYDLSCAGKLSDYENAHSACEEVAKNFHLIY